MWTKLKEEVDAQAGERPDAKMLKRMPYLRACIDECKLKPPGVHGQVAV